MTETFDNRRRSDFWTIQSCLTLGPKPQHFLPPGDDGKGVRLRLGGRLPVGASKTRPSIYPVPPLLVLQKPHPKDRRSRTRSVSKKTLPPSDHVTRTLFLTSRSKRPLSLSRTVHVTESSGQPKGLRVSRPHVHSSPFSPTTGSLRLERRVLPTLLSPG